MENALQQGMEYDLSLVTPLMWLDKAQTWALADKYEHLDLVKNKTLTCYNGVIGSGCGDCPSCKLRGEGLRAYEKNKEYYLGSL